MPAGFDKIFRGKPSIDITLMSLLEYLDTFLSTLCT